MRITIFQLLTLINIPDSSEIKSDFKKTVRDSEMTEQTYFMTVAAFYTP